jgi:hypothetical protein
MRTKRPPRGAAIIVGIGCSNGGWQRQKSLDTRTAPDARKIAPQKHDIRSSWRRMTRTPLVRKVWPCKGAKLGPEQWLQVTNVRPQPVGRSMARPSTGGRLGITDGSADNSAKPCAASADMPWVRPECRSCWGLPDPSSAQRTMFRCDPCCSCHPYFPYFLGCPARTCRPWFRCSIVRKRGVSALQTPLPKSSVALCPPLQIVDMPCHR